MMAPSTASNERELHRRLVQDLQMEQIRLATITRLMILLRP